MTQFNVDSFFSDPQSHLNSILYAKKGDLMVLATKFGVVPPPNAKKDILRNAVLAHCISSELVDSNEASKYLVDVQDKPKSDVEYMKLAIQLENIKRDNMNVELDKKQKEVDIELEKRKKELEFELEKRKKEFELGLEAKRQEIQLDQAKFDYEARVATQVEENKSVIAIQNKKQELELEAKQPAKFDLTKCIKLVPKFDESEVDVFFKNFEDMASYMKWPLEQWVWLVKSKLFGKAATVVGSLVGELNYVVIKKAVLDAYAVTSEGYRQRFRNYVRPFHKTWTEFAAEKLRLFRKWLESEDVESFDELINLIVTEEFKRRLPQNIMMYIADREEKDLKKAAILADNYSLIHKVNVKGSLGNVKHYRAEQLGDRDKKIDTGLFCNYCKKDGHVISNCPNPACRRGKTKNKFPARDESKFNPSAGKETALHCVSRDRDLFEKYICDGKISLLNSDAPVKVRILRDTGSNQSMVLRNTVPSLELLDENTIVNDLTGPALYPLAEVHLDCPYVTSKVKLAVRESNFPLPDVHVLLGNDLAGELPLPNLIMYTTPRTVEETENGNDCSSEDKTDVVENEGKVVQTNSEEAYVNVVTRSMKDKEHEENNVKNVSNKMLMNRENLIRLQKDDQTLKGVYKQALEKGIAKVPGYYFKDDVLFRLYRSPKLSNDETWNDKEQLVVPSDLRKDILEIAHNVNSHFGVNKTYNRLSNDFFWPRMKSDVVNFVKNCHICQIVGKPNEIIPRAPLNPIVVPHEPFHRIIIDCVGPLPKTRKGHQYLLTAMCPTTRYPIAIPLRNISAKTILQHLLKIFTTYGFPKEIQCDQGTNFTSKVFQDVMNEFSIKQSFSSAYHPESQGALERHHQTLKALLKKFCIESESDWDEGVDFLLFVIREVPCESLAISPFEMLYGHKVRGPLQIVKDKLMDSVQVEETTVNQYIQKLKGNIEKIHEFALSHLGKNQEEMKLRYNKNVKVRKFNVGDFVLAFFPIPGSPFKSKFSGPYVVKKCVNNHNYIIKTPDRRKSTQLVHINMLKKYHGVPPTALSCSRDITIVESKTKDVNSMPQESEVLSWSDYSNKEILAYLSQYLQHLGEEQRMDIQQLLQQYEDVCSDDPRECNFISHDIELLPGVRPIRQNYYRLNPEKRGVMKNEVEYLLKHKLAIHSKSPWASPCLLVPKPNGKVRLCTDYRKLNSVTVKDSFPLPRIDDILDAIGSSKFLTQIDMLKGYYQIPLSESAKQMSAFITPFGLFQYERLPFGMCNAPATFQRMVNNLTHDLDGVYGYLDDIVVVSDTWSDHVAKLKKLFKRLRRFGLTINLAKSNFAQAQVKYLGHVIGSGEIFPKDTNIKAILEYPKPTTRKEVMRFLGMTSYYRRFCQNFSSVAHPLISLTSPKSKFEWDETCQNSFNQIKNLLCSKPVLSTPDPSKPFMLQVDACDYGVGAVLLQEKSETHTLHPVSYFSSRLKKHQRSLSTVEKELLAIVQALQKFEVYFSTNNPVTIYSDHNPLVFLNRARNSNQKILRWALFLQNFNITLKHIPGKENYLADALSRAPVPEDSISSHQVTISSAGRRC